MGYVLQAIFRITFTLRVLFFVIAVYAILSFLVQIDARAYEDVTFATLVIPESDMSMCLFDIELYNDIDQTAEEEIFFVSCGGII